MSVFEFNNRPFLLKANKVSKREQQIYNLLTDSQLLAYPYEVETQKGVRQTNWRHFTIDEVRTLLDENDKRTLVDRIDWEETSKLFIQEYGTLAEVKRVAPIAHLPFTCTLVDEDMFASSYHFHLPIEDYVFLVQWVQDNSYMYNVKDLESLRPDIYKRITNEDILPHQVQSSSVILLTSAEQIAAKLIPFEQERDEAYAYNDEFGLMTHLTAEVFEDKIEINEQIATTLDILDTAMLVVNDIDKFCYSIGAFMFDSIKRAIATMYSGKKASLKYLVKFLDERNIKYVLTIEHVISPEKEQALKTAIQNMKDHKYAETVGVLDELAEDGNPEAMYWLSHRYCFGIKVPNNNPEDKKKFDTIHHDYSKSLRLLEESAALAFPPAQYELGKKYYKGDGVEQDYKTAFSLFESSAQQCYVRAMYYVSMCLSKGQGTEVNMTDSIKWCKRGANAGHSRCQYRLASLYAHGCDVDNNSTEPIEPNIAKVIEWCTKSAQIGYPIAQFELAQHYLLGNGVEKDLKQAVSWLQKAAENKLVKAKEMLNELGVES